MVFARGVPGAPAEIFSGKRRKSHVLVQGRFKQPVNMAQLVTGQEFFAPGKNLPPRWIVDNVLLSVARAYDSQVTLESPHVRPRALVPLVSAAQIVQVSKNAASGKLPLESTEDMRLAGLDFVAKNGGPLSLVQRRRVIAAKGHQLTFDTEHTWTFHIWQHFVDLSTYEL